MKNNEDITCLLSCGTFFQVDMTSARLIKFNLISPLIELDNINSLQSNQDGWETNENYKGPNTNNIEKRTLPKFI